jgi:hypothetical protein
MSTPYGLFSPSRHFPLNVIEGDAATIDAAGREYERIGDQMTWTADELHKLHANTKYRAEGLDAIRESAGSLEVDLRRVATRYTGTGPVLVRYAAALRRAQTTTVSPHVDDIVRAHAAAQAADDALNDAVGAENGLDNRWPWEDEPTDAQRSSAAAAVSSATRTANARNGELESLWETFEGGYADWEDAYEAAVTGVRDACEASGIDDTWWEDVLDGIGDVAAILSVVLVIAAIVFAPIAGALLLIATIVSVIALVASLTLLLSGSRRGSVTDVLLNAIGVVPFLGAFAKGMKGGAGVLGALRTASGLGGASRATIAAGRNAVAHDVRSIAGAGGRFGGRAAREARAAGVADDFLRGVQANWGRNAWAALRQGGSIYDGQAYTMSQRMAAAWPGGRAGHAATNWMQSAEGVGTAVQTTNVFNVAVSGYQSAQALGVPLPDLDFVPNPLARQPEH